MAKKERQLIASRLIKSVRERAMIPDDISVYDDESILDILNEEVDVGLLDTLLVLHEEHLVTYTNQAPIQTETGSRVIIPSRSVGSKLREVRRLTDGRSCEMSRIDLGEMSDYESGTFDTGRELFYVEGDEIVFVNNTTSMIRLYYHLRPNIITLESLSGQISAFDTTTGVIQFDEIPKDFVNLKKFDFIQNNSPNKILSFDNPIVSVSISTRTITIDPAYFPRRLSVGDWVCVSETSPYPNVPTEMHPLLAQRAAIFILEALGDSENLASARGKLIQMEKSIQKTLDDRVEGAPRKIKSRHGFLAGRTVYRRKGNY